MKPENFWKRVDVKGPDECWVWKSFVESNGYGRICSPSGVGGPNAWRTHRLAYLIHYGVDPGVLFVLHSCDNPPCCNPHHLRLGTAKDNMQDKIKRGRHRVPIGESVKTSKLKADDVRYILSKASREMIGSRAEMAKKFGVSHFLITKIVDRKIWKHLEC